MSSPKPATEGTRLPPTLGRYHILGHLASGGMAEVLLAKILGPSGFERPVIIKRILPNLAERPEFVRMFLDEARIIAAIRHPNVVQVHELVHENDELYLVMEYLAGESIAGIITRYRALGEYLDYSLCAHIISEACAGLHAAHDVTDGDGQPQNVVHRDISPQNIFVTYDGTTKVLDFGIAKASDRTSSTEAGQLKGKFAYMSPEQCKGLALDRRTDIFALGVVLYEMTTNRRLFARSSAMKTLEAICYGPIAAPSTHRADYPAELERICLKALDRDADKRYQTAAEMRRDLVEVTKSLGFEGIPEEVLAQQMSDVFADRISEKLEMLRSVRSGSALSHIPAAEVSPGLNDEPVPKYAPLPKGIAASGVHSLGTTGSARLAAKRRRSLLWVALVALLAVGAIFFIGPLSSPLRPVQNGSASTAALPPQEPVNTAPVAAAEPPEPEPINLPEPDPNVVVKISSVPAGAEVLINDEQRGETPAEISLERDSGEYSLSLRHRGYRTLERKLSSSNNQQLHLVLERYRRTKPPPRQVERESEPTPDFRRFD